MGNKRFSVQNLSEIIESGFKNAKIIQTLKKTLDGQPQNIYAKDALNSRIKKLEKINAYLRKIKSEQQLSIRLSILKEMMSNYFIDGEQIKIGKPIELDSQLYANVIIDKNKDESVSYILAPICNSNKESDISSTDPSFNILDAIPSTINPNYSDLFRDYPDLIEYFYCALIKTNRIQNEQTKTNMQTDNYL